jgi:hypothetical protein
MQPSDLLALIVFIAVGFLVAVAFYESLCDRDVLLARTLRITRRLTSRPWAQRLAYALVVFVGLPLLVVVWAYVVEFVLILVGTTDRVRDAAVVAAAIVGATRLLSYLRERTSHELAKVLPIALAFALITGGALDLEQKAAAMSDPASMSSLTSDMLLLLIALEIGLRITTDGSNAVLGYARRRSGIESDAGIWATVRTSIRRPFAGWLGRGDGQKGDSGDDHDYPDHLVA